MVVKKKIAIIAWFPPPMHGLAKAVDTLYKSRLNDKYDFDAINLVGNKYIFRTIWSILKQKRDICYFTISQSKFGNMRDLFILWAMMATKAKCIIHLHGGNYKHLMDEEFGALQRWLNRKTVKLLDAAIVLSKSLVQNFSEYIDASRIFVVPNCIDQEFVLSEEQFLAKNNKMKQSNEVHVLFLSNMIASKGYKEVLSVAKMAKNCGNANLFFHFAGKFFDKTEKEHFFSFVKDNSLQVNVIHHGVVLGEEKRNLLQSCDVFILPTTYPWEGQPISILEAMGNGMAIITTNHSGIPDIVEDGKNGLVIDRNNIDAKKMYEYLIYLLGNKNVLTTISSENYKTSMREYTEENYVNNMEYVFEKVISAR